MLDGGDNVLGGRINSDVNAEIPFTDLTLLEDWKKILIIQKVDHLWRAKKLL